MATGSVGRFHLNARRAPFVFKFKALRNAIGGFDYVASFTRLPESLAWECFGDGNGAPSIEALKSRLDDIRERNELRGSARPSQIGCIVVVQAMFFPPDQMDSTADGLGGTKTFDTSVTT